MRALLVVAALALSALALSTSAISASPKSAATVTARASSYGRILFDGRGFALYAFTRDTAKRSACAGACAKAWPPYIVTGRASAGRAVKASLLGTIRRYDGSLQATYAGKPLYYYIGDRKPLQVLCQNVSEFGGLWRVVRPNGTVVR
jgi:predicted lipoprotein with Yx(FWY)xxD motif